MRGGLTGFTKLGVAVFLLAALTFAGCSDNSILGPQEAETSHLDRVALVNAENANEDLIIDNTGELITEKEVNAIVGGMVPINRGAYNHAFEVKPLGLDKNELITVKSKKEKVKDKSALTLEFGPEGLVFNEASKLEVDMSEINPDARTAKLHYYDPRVGDWVFQAEKEVKDGVVVFEIYHFSKYAISD